MKLFSYVVHHDTGLAPNPNGGFCTLAFCKYKKRKCKQRNIVELAKVGDWIVGTGGKNQKLSAGNGTIIYIMRVDEKLPFAKYLRDTRFRGRSQSKKHGEYALVSRTFLYYGDERFAVDQIPSRDVLDHPIEKKGPGFRNDFPETFIRQLADWVRKQHPSGRIGEPCCARFGWRPENNLSLSKIAMTDFHDNVFYYYRGARQSQQGQYDQQLEDNTTKALVNTLQHCNPSVALRFLEWLGIETTGRVRVELQKASIGRERIRSALQRLLLGLVAVPKPRDDSIASELNGPVDGDSRPDAWLYGEGFVVLIESKVGDASLRSDQMSCHLRKLQVDTKHQPKCQVRTWADVHQFFRRLSELNDKDKWLVEQFSQYLEWKGMTEFTGFEEWMFPFLVSDEQDAENKARIRHAMEGFGEKILDEPNGLRALDASFYEMGNVGNFHSGDDHFWVAFGPAKPANFRNLAHQTISLYDYGLDVFVNVELSPAVNLLRERLRDARQTFIELVTALPGPFSVRIEERKKLAQPRNFDYYPIATLEAGTYRRPHSGRYGLKNPASSEFNDLDRLLEIEYPYFSLRRRIERKQVLNLSSGNGDALVDKVLSVMKEFHPLVAFINTGEPGGKWAKSRAKRRRQGCPGR